MFSLVFYRSDHPIFRHDLKGDQITIGRDQEADIQLIEEDISRIHASINWVNGHYFLFDKSRNGTILNSKKVESQKLEKNDTIYIGDWQIKFVESKEDSQRQTVIRDFSPTKILKYEVAKKQIVTLAVELNVVPDRGKKEQRTVTSAVIGAATVNDISLPTDIYISAKHCAIRPTDDGFILEDFGSKNGTLLNGEKIDKVALPEKGTIQIGKSTIRFNIKQISEKITPTATTSLGPIVGETREMREIFTLIGKIASSDAPICVTGESGTGKELIARAVHETSKRHSMPFVAINCGAIPQNLIESELFGHEKGAFTSATGQHQGVFEQAGGGTLFLDEIGEMPMDLQTRLLRVLETHHIKRVGGEGEIPVDVRIVTATNKNLKELVAAKKFREDLFYRLYVVPIELPPLRKRKEDIKILANHFMSLLITQENKKFLSDGAIKALIDHDWPGNVRELKNTIQRAILIATNEEITADDIITTKICQAPSGSLPLAEQKKQSVMIALKKAKGNTSDAARILGIARTTLCSMMKRFDINPNA